MPQKDAPKFLMTLEEIVGGLAAQPRQFLFLQEVGEDLNPLLISFSLMLLLTQQINNTSSTSTISIQ